MKLKYLFAILLIGLAPTARAQPTQLPIAGLWLSKKQDVAVRIMPCAGGTICGKIAWMSADVPQVDPQNKPLCGVTVLNSFTADPAQPTTDWNGGTVFVANKGSTYAGTLHLAAADTLELRAYLGTPLLGKTKTFTRVDAKTYPDCAAIVAQH